MVFIYQILHLDLQEIQTKNKESYAETIKILNWSE
jgi:hypothetical protein